MQAMNEVSTHRTHWINGKPWTGGAATRGDIYNPATGKVSGTVDYATAAEVDTAVAAGSPDWYLRAREARIRRFGPEVPLERAQKARQAAFLQYRGFSSDHIRAATGADPDWTEGP